MSGIENWQHPKEKRYSAASFDQVFQFLVEDPKGIIKHLYRSNSLPRWQTGEMYDEFIQEYSLHLLKKFSADTQGLISMFNTYGNYYLQRYCSNVMNSHSSVHFKRWSGSKQDDIEPYEENICSLDPEFDLDSPVRNVKLTDPDVIKWRLGHPCFSGFTRQQKSIYLKWFDESIAAGQRVQIKDFARRKRKNYRPVYDAIVGINQKMIARIKQIEEDQ